LTIKPQSVLPLTLLALTICSLPICLFSSIPGASSVATPAGNGSTTPEYQAPEHPVTNEPALSPPDGEWSDRELFLGNLSSSCQAVLGDLPGASIYHIAINLSNPPNTVLVAEEIFYTNTESVPLEEINIGLFPNLLGGRVSINSVTLDGMEILPVYTDWLLILELPSPLLPEESLLIGLDVTVEVPSGGGDLYYGIFGYNQGILSLAHVYPTILVFDEEGWHSQKPDLDGDPLFADAAFFLVQIDAPVDLQIVASGTEINRSIVAERQQLLIADGPARDFYMAASAEWIAQSMKAGELAINSYADSERQSEAERALSYASFALEIFGQRYSAYPYTEFDIVPIITRAGGVEYPGMTSISQDVYFWEEDFLELIVVHEVAHMWFYNLVGNDTQNEPWLDEALAQYATWQYYLDRYGKERAALFAQLDLQYTWNMAVDPHAPIGLPVSAYPDSDYSAIIYGRGALFILALRDYMGVELFDDFILTYIQQSAWDIASTELFNSLAEEQCHCDLTPLFDEWVYP